MATVTHLGICRNYVVRGSAGSRSTLAMTLWTGVTCTEKVTEADRRAVVVLDSGATYHMLTEKELEDI